MTNSYNSCMFGTLSLLKS